MADKDFFDDMMDINRDGKYDADDMFLHQMIYNEVTKKDNDNSYSSSNKTYPDYKPVDVNDGFSMFLLVIFMIAGVIGIIMFFGCFFEACSENFSSHKSYHYFPGRSYSSYSSYSYSSNSNSFSSRNSYSSSGNSYSYSYNSNSSYQSKSDDPYNAKDYANEEDFYEDYYDDFYDYDEAEEYYNEHHDD